MYQGRVSNQRAVPCSEEIDFRFEFDNIDNDGDGSRP
jgi:hypothetical protein